MSNSRNITAIGSLVLLIILVAGWFLLLSPRMATASDLNAERDGLKSTNATTRSNIAGLEQKKANIGEAKAQAEVLTKRFPPTAAEAELFALVRTAAEQAGIPERNVTDLTPGVPSLGAGDGSATLPSATPAAGDKKAAKAMNGSATTAAPTAQLASMSLNVTVNGNEAQIIKFLAALESMDRAFLIDSVTYGKTEGKGESSATITGKMFLLPALVDPTAPKAETTPPATPAPATPAPATPSTTP